MTSSPLFSPSLRRLTRALLVLVLPLTFSACSKMADSSMSPGYAGAEDMPPAPMVDVTVASNDGIMGDADMGGGAKYDFDDDMIEGERIEAESVSLMSAPRKAKLEKGRRFDGEGRDRREQQKSAEAPADPSTDQAADAKTGEAPVADQGDEQKPQDHGRQIIYIAGMQLSVYNLEEGMAMLESIPERFGGWVHMRSSNQVVLRVPANVLESVMNAVGDLGNVEARSLQAQDVTAEYVDLESRIKVLRETQKQLLGLLEKAKTVEEALHVRSALDQVTMELEMALGRMRQLGDLISYSTLTVTLVERGPQDNIPTSNDPFRWVDELGVEATEWR